MVLEHKLIRKDITLDDGKLTFDVYYDNSKEPIMRHNSVAKYLFDTEDERDDFWDSALDALLSRLVRVGVVVKSRTDHDVTIHLPTDKESMVKVIAALDALADSKKPDAAIAVCCHPETHRYKIMVLRTDDRRAIYSQDDDYGDAMSACHAFRNSLDEVNTLLAAENMLEIADVPDDMLSYIQEQTEMFEKTFDKGSDEKTED
jgi:hypothetical protein